jgi:serine/threonine protein kinase
MVITMTEWLNRTLCEKFQLVRALKEGHKSDILHLRHLSTGRNIIKRTQTGNAEIYEILRGIRHSNIPRIYEVVSNDTQTIILEEFIDGKAVSARLQESLYSENETRIIIRQLCAALSAIHTLGIIHRDIKPEHLIINNDGIVKLIDYDAARLHKLYKTADTQIIGTTGYAAPEQFGIAQTDERTDIFSLGIMMNVMLVGSHPSKELYRGKLLKVIKKCTQVDPNKRYRNALDLAGEI